MAARMIACAAAPGKAASGHTRIFSALISHYNAAMQDNDNERIERINEILAALDSADLSSQKRAQLEQELDRLGRVLDPPVAAMPDFMQQLKDRQGSIAPDFESLYRRKAELDRKLEER
jgi:hypothetical protein